jgi:RNA-binding protein
MPELSLTRDESLALRARAHNLDPVVLVGSAGFSEAVLKEIDRALSAHGLIKVKAGRMEGDERVSAFAGLADRLQAARVQEIGHLLVLYRPQAETAVKRRPRPEPAMTKREAAVRNERREREAPARKAAPRAEARAPAPRDAPRKAAAKSAGRPDPRGAARKPAKAAARDATRKTAPRDATRRTASRDITRDPAPRKPAGSGTRIAGKASAWSSAARTGKAAPRAGKPVARGPARPARAAAPAKGARRTPHR